MRFLNSIADAIVDRSPEELIGALLIAAAVAIVTAGFYSLGLRNAPPFPDLRLRPRPRRRCLVHGAGRRIHRLHGVAPEGFAARPDAAAVIPGLVVG